MEGRRKTDLDFFGGFFIVKATPQKMRILKEDDGYISCLGCSQIA